ncbi:MAG: imelysin family protein [Pseudomonadota bacterium]
MKHLVFALTLLTICSTQAAGQGLDKAALARGVIAGHIAPGYAQLAEATANLRQKIDAACNGQETLTGPDVQGAYTSALAAWMRVQHIRFGPAMAEDRFYSFQFWPDKHGQAAKQIRRRLSGPIDKIPDKDQIGRGSVALQGFPALERLIFDSKANTPEQRLKACKLATSIGFNLARMAKETAADWQSYAPKEPSEVLNAVVRNMMEQLQIITDLKLGRPLGKSLEGARPRRAESWRSRSSLENIKANLQSLSDLLAGSGKHPGLASVLPNEGETLGMRDAIVEQLAYGIGRIEQQPGSLHDAVSTQKEREAILFLVAHIDGLRQLLFEQLAPALDVNLGFNSQDGD